MKKIFTIFLAVTLLFSLTACGTTQNTANTSVPTTEAAGTTEGNEKPAVSGDNAFVGRWFYSYTNNEGTVVAKSFEVREDFTATIVTTQTHSDGTVEEKTVDYTWELNENGQVVTRSEKHTAVYNFNQEADTLTNRNATAEKFTRVG